MAEYDQSESTAAGTKRDRDLIATAMKRFKWCEEAEHEMRQKCLDDLVFLEGTPEGQWGAASIAQRFRDKRPALVFNRMDAFAQHISNSMRQNRVSARVFPVDDKADIDTAEVRQGLIRHTEYISNADVAYHRAAFYAVAMGFGYYYLNTEYSDPLTFEQEIKIESVENQFNVYLGPHTRPDGADAEYGFIFNDMTKEEYRSEYPKTEMAGLEDWKGVGESDTGWVSEETCRVASYYYTEWKHGTLVAMRDGTNKLKSEIADNENGMIRRDEDGEPIERPTRIPTVKFCKLNAIEILEETEWPIPQVPIIKVTGHELNVDGRRVLKGIVRNLKDAQRQYNFMLSAQTEAVDNSKGNLTLYEGQEEGHEQEIKQMSKGGPIRVKAMTDASGGQILPLPQRLPPNMSIPAMTEARAMAADDLKALSSIYDAALGARSNETSGRAIGARQQQSDTANFHFQDNLTISITHSTRMIVNMQGIIYDTARVVRIIGEDDAQKVAKINQDFEENGKVKRHDFKVGKYDVVCTAGPSFATKRKEAAELLVQLAGSAPIIMNAAPDIVMKSIDVPYAQEISDRLKKTLPPELQEQEGKPEIPPQVQQKMALMEKMTEALTQKLNEANETIKTKQLELASKERIEMAKLQADAQTEAAKIDAELRIKHAELDSEEAIARLKAEVEMKKLQVNFEAGEAEREAKQFADAVAEPTAT